MAHAPEVAGYIAIIRLVVDGGTKQGLAPPKIALDGIELSERWLRGEAITYEAFATSNQANIDAQGKLGSMKRDEPFRWSLEKNLLSAVANLCCFAAQMEGWTSAKQGIVDACTYALYSLERKVDLKRPLAIGTQLEALVADAAAQAPTEFAKRTTPTPHATKTRGIAKSIKARDVARHVGKLAAARLVHQGARVDPTRRGTEDELCARLEQLAYPILPPVVSFEGGWGGTIFPCVFATNEWDSLLGAYGCLATGGIGAERKRVPIARGPYDDVYYADASGRVWAHWIDRPIFAWASDPAHMVARLVLSGLVWERLANKTATSRVGNLGEEIASALALPVIEEASDDCGRAWGDEHSLVLEQFGETLISSDAAGCIERWVTPGQ